MLLVLIIGAVTAPAAAQSQNIRQAPGLNDRQRAMGAAIDVVCPNLAGARPAAGFSDPAVEELFLACRAMRRTALALSGGAILATALSSAEQLAQALDEAGPTDQSALGGTAANQITADTNRVISGRLAALRRGSSGFGISRLDFDMDKTMNASGAPVLRTGAASADLDVGGKIGAFGSVNFAFGDKDDTSREIGFDVYSASGVAGAADYRLTENVVVGGALTYTFTLADLSRLLGDVETHAYGVTGYGSFYAGDFYLDAHMGFTWSTYDTRREIATFGRVARGETEGPQGTAGVGAGYSIRSGSLTATPFGRLEYLAQHIDGYSERGAGGLNLEIEEQLIQSVQSALGATVAYQFSLPFGVLVPQVRGEWRHEFANGGGSVTARYVSDPPRSPTTSRLSPFET